MPRPRGVCSWVSAIFEDFSLRIGVTKADRKRSSFGAPLETSAKTNTGVFEAFSDLVIQVSSMCNRFFLSASP